MDEVKLRRKFPFVVDFLPTDALPSDGIEELRRTIHQAVEERMRDVWLPFPQHWLEIKDTVAGMPDNFLTYSQYTKLCTQCGEKDPAAQADLAGILHALGLALYFAKDARLHDTRVLNPGWVTGDVDAVIRAPSVAAYDGQLAVCGMSRGLREAERLKVIKAADYPPKTRRFILELMRAFQLCYASDEAQVHPERYLVPGNRLSHAMVREVVADLGLDAGRLDSKQLDTIKVYSVPSPQANASTKGGAYAKL